jgi:mono/diheme cytochrome c family protein
MAEVVANSTQYMSTADLTAMAVYLKGLSGSGETTTASTGNENQVDQKAVAMGRAVYNDDCTGCHMANGRGQPGVFPSLVGNPSVLDTGPQSVVQTILHGDKIPVTSGRPTGLMMPAFDWKLDNQQVAAVATFIRNSWGNKASDVDTSTVQSLRTQ